MKFSFEKAIITFISKKKKISKIHFEQRGIIK